MIGPSAPFGLDLSAKIFADGDRQILSYQEGVFKQVIRADGKLVLVSISSEGAVDAPLLKVELRSETELNGTESEKVRVAVTRIFNLDLDLRSFYELARNDRTMQKITIRLRGLRSLTTPTVFESLIDSIVEQQISLIAATSIEKKIIKKFGEQMMVDGETFYVYPTPERMSLVSIDDLRGLGSAQHKAEYIKDTVRT